jgi:hypothetical protein
MTSVMVQSRFSEFRDASALAPITDSPFRVLKCSDGPKHKRRNSTCCRIAPLSRLQYRAELKIGHRTRLTEQESLDMSAAGRTHGNKLLFGFNALGNSSHPQLPREARYGGHDRSAVGVRREFKGGTAHLPIVMCGRLARLTGQANLPLLLEFEQVKRSVAYPPWRIRISARGMRALPEQEPKKCIITRNIPRSLKG